jgi:hypothetical protein
MQKFAIDCKSDGDLSMASKRPKIQFRYYPRHFQALADDDFGQALWQFLLREENWLRMETASLLQRPAVEALAPGLLVEFGREVGRFRVKQMIGHMVQQIMAERGYRVAQQGVRITRSGLFASGARYARRGTAPRGGPLDPRKRKLWLAEMAGSDPFNRWFDQQVYDKAGDPTIPKLHELARRYEVRKRYEKLHPELQCLNIRVLLRARVPAGHYRDSS